MADCNKKTTDGAALIPAIVQAAMGGKTFRQASKPLSEDDRQLLSRGIRMDVDEWRREFAAQLREAGSELLAELRARRDELKPGEIAYALSVVADKSAALDARSQTLTTAVNQQVNNFYGLSREELLSALDGKKAIQLPPASALSHAMSPAAEHPNSALLAS